MTARRLVLFDLDHTLLNGDSDELWCDYLIALGKLQGEHFSLRNAEMTRDYKAGVVDAKAFAEFYIDMLRLHTVAEWQPFRETFLHEWISPRIGQEARHCVAQHLTQGDQVVLTTATNRFITELTAQHLGIAHLIATEPECQDGAFTGKTQGILNMREGKVQRLHDWLDQQGLDLQQFETWGYSDSINDRPLLELVQNPIAVQPDDRLHQIALEKGWPVIRWYS
jgi:HAD superfamily hydrolase (TIGR01490 family)